MRSWVVGSLLLLSSGSAALADPPSFAALSTDNMATCMGFQNKSAAQQDLATAWVAGFVSGANAGDTGEKRNAGLNWTHSDVRTWLRAWCLQHPRMPISTAAAQLRQDLLAQP